MLLAQLESRRIIELKGYNENNVSIAAAVNNTYVIKEF
jgi:hypothetical protein